MATNEIYPFGTEGTVEDGDVMELAEYQAEPQRLAGNQLGIARRELVNTALRQALHMAAGLARFIAGRYVGGVVDDGDLDKVEAGLIAAIARCTRIRLNADLTVYVATDGDDTADGLSAETPLASIQAAYDLLADSYDLVGHTATIQMADGTYAAGLAVARPVPGSGIRSVILAGNADDPTAVEINAHQDIAVTEPGCAVAIRNFKCSGTWGLVASNYGLITTLDGITFGEVSNTQIAVSYGGAVLVDEGYTVAGGANSHVLVKDGYLYARTGTITFSGAPDFGVVYKVSELGEVHVGNATFVGSATGVRYQVDVNGVLMTGGGGSTIIPGDTAGTTGTGGQYV